MKTATFILLLAATSGFAANRKVAPHLNTGDADRPVDVIVRYRVAPEHRHEQSFKTRGAQVRSRLDLVQSIAYTVPASALEELANDPDVEYIAPDRKIAGMLDYAEPTINAN